VFEVHGLLNEVIRAFLHRGDGLFDRTVRRDQDDGNGGIGLFRFAQHVQTGAAGQFEVREHEQISPGAHLRDGCRAVRRLVHFMPGAFQRLAQHRAQFCFVLDQEKRFHRALFYHVFAA